MDNSLRKEGQRNAMMDTHHQVSIFRTASAPAQLVSLLAFLELFLVASPGILHATIQARSAAAPKAI
jgi:hypothetical protein